MSQHILLLTVNPEMQTVNGRMRMYQPAQNPATGNPRKSKMRNQMILHKIDWDAILIFGLFLENSKKNKNWFVVTLQLSVFRGGVNKNVYCQRPDISKKLFTAYT